MPAPPVGRGPGGAGGEGFVRWALVPTPAECREAILRLESVENG